MSFVCRRAIANTPPRAPARILVALTTAAPATGVILIVVLADIVALGISRSRGVQKRMQGRELRFYSHGLMNVGVGNEAPRRSAGTRHPSSRTSSATPATGLPTHTTYL
jgi:hypothetical protein